MDNLQLIGKGILNWPRDERVTDRYGCVNLFVDGKPMEIDNQFEGLQGSLIAIVKETRKSMHIGDIFAGHSTSKPMIDESFVLGEGSIFYDEYNSIGLQPFEHRDSNWLDPKVLYKLHSQTVELYFKRKD